MPIHRLIGRKLESKVGSWPGDVFRLLISMATNLLPWQPKNYGYQKDFLSTISISGIPGDCVMTSGNSVEGAMTSGNSGECHDVG